VFNGHTWNSVRDNNGVHISFMGTETNPGEPHNGITYLKAKAYRYVFANQNNISTDLANIPPLLLQANNIIDVTHEYESCADVKIPILNSYQNNTGYAYLSINRENEWHPIGWGRTTSDSIEFLSVKKNILYMSVYFNNGVQSPASYPFMLTDSGSLLHFEPDLSQMERITLIETKSPEYVFMNRMLHGRFEGANRSDFSDAEVLHRITEMHGLFFHTANIRNSSSFRYIRYVSPQNGFCNVAELEFYDKNGSKLSGSIIGTTETWENSTMTRDKAFDGDAETFLDAVSSSGAWVGLDLGKPVAIGKIRFFPRTHNDIIYKGLNYRLSYWDGNQFIQLHKQVATDNNLEVTVPANAMFYLQNITRNRESSYFVITDGKQKW